MREARSKDKDTVRMQHALLMVLQHSMDTIDNNRSEDNRRWDADRMKDSHVASAIHPLPAGGCLLMEAGVRQAEARRHGAEEGAPRPPHLLRCNCGLLLRDMLPFFLGVLGLAFGERCEGPVQVVLRC